MPNLSPEQQAKVNALMAKCRVFYDAIKAAKPPTELGLALRDGLPFGDLKDESVGAIAVAVTNYEKGLAAELEKLAKMPTPEAAPTTNGEPAAAPDVTPTTRRKGAEATPKT